MPRAPIPWSGVEKPFRFAYPTRNGAFGAASAACVADFAASMISWLRWLPNKVRPTPGSRQLWASTKTASRAPWSRASWTAAYPVALSISSVGCGAKEATIRTTSPKAWASAHAHPIEEGFQFRDAGGLRLRVMVQRGSEELQSIDAERSEEGTLRDLRIRDRAREKRGEYDEGEDDLARRERHEQGEPDEAEEGLQGGRREGAQMLRIRGRAQDHLAGPEHRAVPEDG